MAIGLLTIRCGYFYTSLGWAYIQQNMLHSSSERTMSCGGQAITAGVRCWLACIARAETGHSLSTSLVPKWQRYSHPADRCFPASLQTVQQCHRSHRSGHRTASKWFAMTSINS